VGLRRRRQRGFIRGEPEPVDCVAVDEARFGPAGAFEQKPTVLNFLPA
jgi:hypothetical protein